MEIAQYKLEVEAAYKDKVCVCVCACADLDVLFSNQIATLESQSKKDVSTITRINSELRKLSSSLGETNNEFTRLQRAVSIQGGMQWSSQHLAYISLFTSE